MALSTRNQRIVELEEIEARETDPTHAEWIGVLHDIAIDPVQRMKHRIRALAQMDRITGTPLPHTPQAVKFYCDCHQEAMSS